MQLPTTLANAIVPFPSATLRKEIATSGAQVPNATIVNAINILGILQRIAKEDAQSTKISLDLIIIINPKSKKTYMQEVPIYSAIKVNGKKLYEYARSGKEVELPKKEVTVKKIKLLSSDNDTFMIKAKVTKGCYIRSLIRDIGRSLDTYATMTTLVRTKQGKVDIKETNTLEEIKTGTSILHKIDEVLDLPTITVNEEIERKIKNGVKLPNKYQIGRAHV